MPCAEPIFVDEAADTPEDILRVHAQNAGRWKICRDRHGDLADAVRERQRGLTR